MSDNSKDSLCSQPPSVLYSASPAKHSKTNGLDSPQKSTQLSLGALPLDPLYTMRAFQEEPNPLQSLLSTGTAQGTDDRLPKRFIQELMDKALQDLPELDKKDYSPYVYPLELRLEGSESPGSTSDAINLTTSVASFCPIQHMYRTSNQNLRYEAKVQ